MDLPRLSGYLWAEGFIMVFLSRSCVLLAVLGMLLLGSANAQPVLDRVRTAGALKVCIWPEYYGVTYRHPRTQELSGIDIELAAALAADLNAAARAFVADLVTRGGARRRAELAARREEAVAALSGPGRAAVREVMADHGVMY